jgi:hypothetical protein
MHSHGRRCTELDNKPSAKTLTLNQRVVGSNPSASTIFLKDLVAFLDFKKSFQLPLMIGYVGKL